MAFENVYLTLGLREDKIVGEISLDTEIEMLMRNGTMFVLMLTVLPDVEGEEQIDLTLIPLPVGMKG